jgi:1-acyl-sn-glycerol-3-phosphate acyltransferase
MVVMVFFPMHFGEWLRQIFPWWVRHYHRLEIRGIEHLPRTESAIIAANHSGGWDLDNFCLMSVFDQFRDLPANRKHIWLAYWDKWAMDLKPWAIWVQKFSPIPINLQGKGFPFPLIDRLVQKGELIAIMPEGHSASIQEGYRLWRFYPGVIQLHLRYHIPIIPTVMVGFVEAALILANRYNSSVVPPWEDELICPMIFPKKLIIEFGTPLNFPSYWGIHVDKSTQFRLAGLVRHQVKTMLATYRSPSSPSFS